MGGASGPAGAWMPMSAATCWVEMEGHNVHMALVQKVNILGPPALGCPCLRQRMRQGPDEKEAAADNYS